MIIQWFAILGSAGLLGLILMLIRRNALKERYALLWLGACAVMLLLSIWRDLLNRVALFFQVYYPPSFLFLAAFLFLLLILLHLTVVVSQMSERIKTLVHRLALLELGVDATDPHADAPERKRDSSSPVSP